VDNVLRSARTKLIFSRSQEGTQPGRLTQPGQTEQGIGFHVPSCWVLVEGSWVAGRQSQLRSGKALIFWSCSFSLLPSCYGKTQRKMMKVGTETKNKIQGSHC